MSNQLTPMQEFITALTENGLISINQTLIDGALKQEQQVIEEKEKLKQMLKWWLLEFEYDNATQYQCELFYNTKQLIKQNEK